MRKFFIISSVVFVSLLAAILIGPSFVDWNNYKKPVQDKIRDFTGFETVMEGDVSLMLLPAPNFTLNNLKIINPNESQNNELLSLEKLSVNIDLVSLFSGQLNVTEIHVVRPKASLYADARGRPNWTTSQLETLLEKPSQVAQNQLQETQSSASQEQAEGRVFIKRIRIDDGALRFANDQTGANVELIAINMNIDAQGVSGPYIIEGGLQGFEQSLEFRSEIPAFEPGVENIAMNTSLVFPLLGLNVTLDGVSMTRAPYDTQGNLTIIGDDIGQTLQRFGFSAPAMNGQPLRVSGFANISAKEAVLNTIQGLVGDNDVYGEARVVFDPLIVNIALESLKNQLGVFTGLNVRIAKSGEALLFNDTALSLGYQNKIFLDGRIKTQSRVADLSLRTTIEDVPAFAQALSFAPDAFPLALQSISMQTTLNGPFSRLKYDSKIRALGAVLGMAGVLQEPYTIENLSKSDLSLQHNNLAALLNDLQNGASAPASLKAPIRASAALETGDNIFHLKDLNVALAGNTITGQADVDLSGKRPLLKADLDIGTLKITDEGFAASQSAGQSSGGAAVRTSASPQVERWSAEPFNLDALQSVNLDLNLSGKSLVYDRWVIDDPVVTAQLQDGVLNVSTLQGGLYGGQISMPLNVRALPGEPLVLSAAPDIRNVALEPLVRSLIGRPVLSGEGGISLMAQLNTLGNSPKDMISALQGNGDLSGGAMTLNGFDVGAFARALSDDLKPGDSLKSLWGGVSRGGSTDFESLEGAFDIQGGVVTLNGVDLTGPQANMATTGTVDLPRWRIDTDHVISIPGQSDIPSFTIEIDGPLDNPAQTFGQGLLEDYLKRKLERKVQKELQGRVGQRLQEKLGDELGGALGGALGGLLGVPQQQEPANDNEQDAEQTMQQQQQNQNQPTTPQDALDSILRGVLR